MTAHPIHTSCAISLFSPLTGDASWNNGLFKICASSHSLSLERSQGRSTNDISHDLHAVKVEKGCVLLVEGAASVQPSPYGGMKMLWLGLAEHPVGRQIKRDSVFPFMRV
ncbi:hypothetical protein BDW75DRAFT_84728 [Aspergillus navahoensis]